MRKVFKTIVSIILSLTFILSYLNIMQDDVSAASARIVLGQTINVPQDDYTYEFRPDKTGYYMLDTREWSSVDVYEAGEDEPLSCAYIIPVGLYTAFEEGSYQEIYYMEYGKTYDVHFWDVCAFVLRRVDKYVYLNIGSREVNASLDQPFTLTITPSLSPNLQLQNDITYWWTDLPNDPGYTTSSITLNLSDLLDESNHFIYGYEYGDDESDFGKGFVSCYVSTVYDDCEFGWWVTYDINGFATAFSSKCEAYDEDYGYEMCMPINYGWDDAFFNVVTEQPAGVNVSYQWYKVDSARKIAGNYEKESDLYTKINGQTYNYFNFNQPARNILGNPYYYYGMNDEEFSAYHELACVVKFTKGTSVVERVLNFKLLYEFGVETRVLGIVNADYSSVVNLPHDSSYRTGESDDLIIGDFIEDVLPNGFSYRYTWYDCPNILDATSYSWTGREDFDLNEIMGNDYVCIGSKKDISINTSSLSSLKYSTEYGYYAGYVACYIEPLYNGERTYNNYLQSYFEVFEIYYGSFEVTRQTNVCDYIPGVKNDIEVEVESVFDVTYQWQQLSGKNWININSASAKTAKLEFVTNEDTQCRCVITDAKGNTIYSDPCILRVAEYACIVNDPVDFYGYVGDTAKFTVEVYGEVLSYQWQLKKGSKWANLTTGGANTPTLSVKVDESKNGKTYRCVITNDKGNELITDEVSIHVIEPAIDIITQPKNYSGPEGSTAKFSVVAEGDGLTYQWQLKKGSSWANLSSGGAKTPNMSIKVDGSKNGKTYRCLITNADGEQLATDEVKITVKDPDITINSQPANYSGLEGSTAKFTVVATGTDLTYQWQLKKGNSWADLSSGGAKTASMSIKVDSSKDGKTYRCLITNAAGEQLATNEVTITVKQPSNAITITKQPENTETYEGGTAGFMVEAVGEGLTYQWQLKKGSSWANLTSGGATTNRLSLGKCDMSKNGTVYRCVITDANGEQIVTDEVTLTVYYVVYRSEAVKAGEPAPDTEVPATASEPAAEPSNEAPAPVEAPAEETAPATVETPAPAPVETPPAEAPADSPVEEPA